MRREKCSQWINAYLDRRSLGCSRCISPLGRENVHPAGAASLPLVLARDPFAFDFLKIRFENNFNDSMRFVPVH